MARPLRQRYWTALNDYLISSGSGLRTHKPSSNNWMKIRSPEPFRRTKAHLAATALIPEKTIRANVVLEDPDSELLFDELRDQREAIEEAMGGPLEWVRRPKNKDVCRIYVPKQASFTDEPDWDNQFKWFRGRLERLHVVFGPLVI